MRCLEGFGKDPAWRDVPIFALPRKFIGLPYFGQHGYSFIPALSGLTRVDALTDLFVGVGAAGAHFHAAVGQLVDHGHPFRHPYGMVVGQDGHSEADANILGALAERAEHHFRTGRTGEPKQEVVLDEPEVVESHLVGKFALVKSLPVQGVPVDFSAFIGTLHLK